MAGEERKIIKGGWDGRGGGGAGEGERGRGGCGGEGGGGCFDTSAALMHALVILA